MALLTVVGCGGGGKSTPLPPATYSIGGTVTGLTGTGLVLQDNGGSNLTVNADGAFSFTTAITSGGAYSVTVLAQPTGEKCVVVNGSGAASANVSNVSVACAQAYAIGGTVAGLTGTGLVLQDNGGNNLDVSANGSFSFTFAGPIPSGGAPYFVTVVSDPAGQACTVINNSGTASANVTSVQVSCSNLAAVTYTIGGTVTGLTGSMLVLQDNFGSNRNDNLWVNADGSFTFVDPVTSGDAYSVTVLTQPVGKACTMTNGSGAVSANVTNVSVVCVGEWTWMGGSTTVGSNDGQSGVYGTLGMAASTNIPGGRDSAMTWTDASGNLWLFGGEGYDSTGAFGYLNDVWKFNPKLGINGEWTWMGGSNSTANSQSGVYGTLGTADPTNVPGGRYSAVSWSDASGDLWLFGGEGYDLTGASGALNDLWKFDTKLGTNGEWTWMGGSSTVGSNGGQSGVYGTLGTADPKNVPGGRGYAVSWSDASGNLWLFGGYGFDSAGTTGYSNDLWKFNLALGEWTWMGGSSTIGSSTATRSGVYGTQGTPAPTNIPGGRGYAVSWSDASGNLWLFGGYGYDSTGKSWGYLNDLWKFDPKLGTNGEWAWMGGSSKSKAAKSGDYGTLGVAASTNVPGSRVYPLSWSDASGNLWLFGGLGYDSTSAFGVLNDLWKFDPALGANGEWAWMGGSNAVGSNGGQSGVYGTLGTEASTNAPGGRDNAVSWSDASGNLWLFGGLGYDSTGIEGDLNDLWKYQP
jgi:N-acetylneuraminic acid mutarotase